MWAPTVFLPLCHFRKDGKSILYIPRTFFLSDVIQQCQTLSLKKKSLWQRKIKPHFKNRKKRRKIITDLCPDERMTQRCKKEETSDTREVMLVHAFSTGLHCTKWSNYRKKRFIMLRMQARSNFPPKIWQSIQRIFLALTKIHKSFDHTSA